MDKIIIIISAIVALVLFGAFNGVVIKWHNAHAPFTPLFDAEDEQDRQDEIKRLSTYWHWIAMYIRTVILWVVWFSSHDWIVTSATVVLTAIEYNVSINLINGLKWWYFGTTAKTDRLIRKCLPFINFDK